MLLVGHDVNMLGTQVILTTPQPGITRTCTKSVVRSREGRNVTTSIEPKADSGCITLDDGRWKKTYDPRRRTVTISRAASRLRDAAEAMRQVRLIRRNYSVAYDGIDPIAGRRCYRLSLVPRTKVSHPCSIWIDVTTGAVLCHRESDWATNTVGLMLFTSVTFPATVSKRDLACEFPSNAKRVNLSRSPVLRDVAELERRMGYALSLPITMPGGFEFDSCELVALDGMNTACLHYTDGLSNLTICQSKSKDRRPLGYRMLNASYHPQGDVMVACGVGDMDFMVIGHGEVNGLALVARALDSGRETAVASKLASVYGVSRDDMRAARTAGIAMDVLALLLETAKRSHRRIGDLVAQYRDTWNWRTIAQNVRVDPSKAQLAVQRLQMP